MTSTRMARVVCLAAVALSATSCASTPDSSADLPPTQADPGNGDTAGANAAGGATAGANGTSSTIPASETLATFTESEVVGMVIVTSSDAIEQASFAQLRAENPEVKAFAERMIADHTRALGRLSGLRAVSAGPDPTSALLQREDQVVALDLQTQGGAAVFELAYMTTQVAAQARMIAMLDRSFLPSLVAARSTRAVMLDVRSMYVGHLVKALDLQQRVLRSLMTAGTPDSAGGGGGNAGSPLRITPHK